VERERVRECRYSTPSMYRRCLASVVTTGKRVRARVHVQVQVQVLCAVSWSVPEKSGELVAYSAGCGAVRVCCVVPCRAVLCCGVLYCASLRYAGKVQAISRVRNKHPKGPRSGARSGKNPLLFVLKWTVWRMHLIAVRRGEQEKQENRLRQRAAGLRDKTEGNA
jgi:hypothetical protein